MELIDTHAHLTFGQMETDIEAVLHRSIAAGVTSWITIGTDRSQNQKALALAAEHENMYAGLGFHPHEAKDASPDELEFLKELCGHDKVVAVGETGLDYHYDHSPRNTQQEVFQNQLRIAAETALPVIVHTREAFDETMDILDDFAGKLKNVVIHCYGGTEQQTELVLDRGYHVSFTGTVTFKRNTELRRVAKMIPLDRLMVETDCPYISPEPLRNKRPNEPAFLVHTAKKLAEVHEIQPHDFAKAITETSKKFFNMP